MTAFLEAFFDDILDCEWRWHRFEWQSRSAIHAHGCARFKNDPGLINLTTLVYKGRQAKTKLEESRNIVEIAELVEIIKIGEESETKIITYVDNLITAVNTRTIPEAAVVKEPHPCSVDYVDIVDKDLDYEDICNCCQRHVCRILGYCKSSSDSKRGKCRFDYPLPLEEKTKIEFIETKRSIRAEIKLKRNDSFLNMHNRLITQNWRANTDMQIILDISACINYMVKYATKGK